MSFPLGNLLVVLSLIGATLLVGTVADAPYTYTEGFLNQGDAVFLNCTYNLKGTWGAVKQADIPIRLEAAGAKITYINIENNKPNDQKPTISKVDGGTGFNYVSFRAFSVESHGFLFHFDVRGTTSPGATEHPLLGNCRR